MAVFASIASVDLLQLKKTTTSHWFALSVKKKQTTHTFSEGSKGRLLSRCFPWALWGLEKVHCVPISCRDFTQTLWLLIFLPLWAPPLCGRFIFNAVTTHVFACQWTWRLMCFPIRVESHTGPNDAGLRHVLLLTLSRDLKMLICGTDAVGRAEQWQKKMFLWYIQFKESWATLPGGGHFSVCAWHTVLASKLNLAKSEMLSQCHRQKALGCFCSSLIVSPPVLTEAVRTIIRLYLCHRLISWF